MLKSGCVCCVRAALPGYADVSDADDSDEEEEEG